MGRFGRKVARGKARDLGLLLTKGQQGKIATRAKRMWCPKCELVCDAQDAVRWSEWTALSSRKVWTLRCTRCGTQVEGRDLSELPEGTPKNGRWFRPGPDGWGGHAAIRSQMENHEAAYEPTEEVQMAILVPSADDPSKMVLRLTGEVRRVSKRMLEEARRDETGAGEGGETSGAASAGAAQGEGMESG